MPTKVIKGQPYEVRKVIKLGQSLAISLPHFWCIEKNIEEGGEVYLGFEADRIVLRTAKDLNDSTN